MKAARVVTFLYLLMAVHLLIFLPRTGLAAGPRDLAGGALNLADGHEGVLIGGNAADMAKASRDTVHLIGPWGSSALANGQFQNPDGSQSWNGWTHWDLTQPDATHWQVSDYQADNLGAVPSAGNLAAWCGELYFEACTPEDVVGGYGNNWNEILEWVGTVADPAQGVQVSLSAYLNQDTEPGYDFFSVRYFTTDGSLDAYSFSGIQSNQFLETAFSLTPADYQGPDQDQVVIQLVIESDGGWSDEDCIWPTSGAAQIDDITVTLTQGQDQVSDFTDFQAGTGSWDTSIPDGVGDFSQIWTNLDDIDPCNFNYSAQVAFIDDGQIVPGVGPSLCIDWCYGPGGYIVNTTGGRVGPPDGHLHNAIESPVLAWPSPLHQGATLDFDVFRHEEFSSTSPGIFYTWSVRSTTSSDPEDIQLAGWRDRNFVFFGGPDYMRTTNVVSDLLEPGLQYAQVQLTIYELGFIWGVDGNNGTPAPYFDNVRLAAYPYFGPGLSAREIDLAQDNFPTNGEVDLVNLGNNSVRFDMARNIFYGQSSLVNYPGDTIIVDIVSLRAGAAFTEEPSLHFKLKRNPVFDPYRTSAFGTADEGMVYGIQASNGQVVIPDRYAFDLPDSNFLFPGDVLHYYIKATDDDGMEVQSATLPADTTGFSNFHRVLGYHSSFTVRALPSVFYSGLSPQDLTTPKVLFWNDFGNRGGQDEWHGALANLGLLPGRDIDVYYTNGPSSGVGNGLGGRATALALSGYEDLLYTSGNLSTMLLGNGDGDYEVSDDFGVLDSWLRQGGKDILFTGDDFASAITDVYPQGNQFLTDWLGVLPVSNSVRPLIHNQSSPRVQAIAGNGVLTDGLSWIAYGGCQRLNTFDAIDPDLAGGSIQLAEFLDPNGAPGFYSYSAGTLRVTPQYGARVITLPYDLMYIHDDAMGGGKSPAPLPVRAVFLEQVLAYFGVEGNPLDVSPVPEALQFATRSYPNPFNPAVTIEYTMPRVGHLSLKVFNVRGELVKTLIDEQIESSGSVVWDGTDDRGLRASSGVYFTEARSGGQVKVGKLVMVK